MAYPLGSWILQVVVREVYRFHLATPAQGFQGLAIQGKNNALGVPGGYVERVPGFERLDLIGTEHP